MAIVAASNGIIHLPPLPRRMMRKTTLNSTMLTTNDDRDADEKQRRPVADVAFMTTWQASQARRVITISPNAADPPITTDRNDSPLLLFAMRSP